MNWTDAMKNNANVVSRDHDSPEVTSMHSAAATSWDPHEVWLTRVKEPRDRAASRASDNALVAPLAPNRSSPR